MTLAELIEMHAESDDADAVEVWAAETLRALRTAREVALADGSEIVAAAKEALRAADEEIEP